MECKRVLDLQIPKSTGSVVRTLRIHYLSESQRHQLFYNQKGRDEVICNEKWLRVCSKKLHKLKNHLEKNLWKCRPFKDVTVFYPSIKKP